MPLFFILSGYVAKSLDISTVDFIAKKVKQRAIPILFFNSLTIPLWFICDNYSHKNMTLSLVANKTIRTIIAGHPAFNCITWFIVCLSIIEIFDYTANKYLSKRCTYASNIVIYAMGFIVAYKIDFITESTGIMENFWCIHTALVAYPLYTLGKLINETRVLMSINKITSLVLLVIAVCLTYSTFDLNHAGQLRVVTMYGLRYGNPVLFSFTAIIGSTSIILLSMLTPKNRILNFIGNNSIYFLGLNGIIAIFINHKIISILSPILPDNNISIFCASSLITIGCLAVCFPATLLLRRVYPFFEGGFLSNCKSAKNIISQYIVT